MEWQLIARTKGLKDRLFFPKSDTNSTLLYSSQVMRPYYVHSKEMEIQNRTLVERLSFQQRVKLSYTVRSWEAEDYTYSHADCGAEFRISPFGIVEIAHTEKPYGSFY